MNTLPEHVISLAADEPFTFSCHSGVTCFTECCRELELLLSPYDIYRLKSSLRISSEQFLDQYAIIEFLDTDLYPKVYLAMIDDGRASCPFVNKQGCWVYNDRPGPCRTYPLGRGACQKDGEVNEIFVLLKEPHCQGFSETKEFTVKSWYVDQGIGRYNEFNDLFLPIFNAPYFNAGTRLNNNQAEMLILALYNTDAFREKHPELFSEQTIDERTLYNTAINWLKNQIFI